MTCSEGVERNSATQVLRNEHDHIVRMLDATEHVSRLLDGGTVVAPQLLNNIIEFLGLFADRCHHGKEEDLLFPQLEQKGLPGDGGPIAGPPPPLGG